MRKSYKIKAVALAFALMMAGTGIIPATAPVKVQAASKKVMLAKYKSYLAKKQKKVKNYAIVYFGNRPALLTNMEYFDEGPMKGSYKIKKSAKYGGYSEATLNYYKKGKVRKIYDISCGVLGATITYKKGVGILTPHDEKNCITVTKSGKLKLKDVWNKYTAADGKAILPKANTKKNRAKIK